MLYDPSKPVERNNPLPQSMWPYKQGQKVLAITRTGIERGVVTFFQPALNSTYLVTKGRPLVTLRITGSTEVEVVSLNDVRPDTRAGRGELLWRLHAAMHEHAEAMGHATRHAIGEASRAKDAASAWERKKRQGHG